MAVLFKDKTSEVGRDLTPTISLKGKQKLGHQMTTLLAKNDHLLLEPGELSPTKTYRKN